MENRKELAIVSCCNTNFVPHLAAMFVSILENSPSAAAVHFYVIDDGLSLSSKKALQETVSSNSQNATVEFLTADKEFIKIF